MKTFEDLFTWIRFRQELESHGTKIGFVPTMGALHEGHLSLLRRAKAENDFVLVSIFVNPTQFNNKEDLEKYPRTLDLDLAALRNEEVDGLLLPNEKEIYPDGYRFKLTESQTSQILCGAHRPGHFNGVLTVVLKLLGLAQAHRCYMGEKDFQQFKLVHEMATSFFVNTEIIPCPTLRETSGLAMSSRNSRLSPRAREHSALIYKSLIQEKTPTDAKTVLTENGFGVEYVEEHWGRRFVAVNIENVRLIDNVAL